MRSDRDIRYSPARVTGSLGRLARLDQEIREGGEVTILKSSPDLWTFGSKGRDGRQAARTPCGRLCAQAAVAIALEVGV